MRLHPPGPLASPLSASARRRRSAAAAVGLLLQVTLKIGAKQFLNIRDLFFVISTFLLVALYHVSLPVVLFLVAPLAIILCRPARTKDQQ